MVPIPEGQQIVQCPYCELRSYVRGERGIRRYQVPLRVQRQAALQSLGQFLSKTIAIARDAARNARPNEAFVVFLPFWTVWARVAGWAFGQKRVGSGDNQRYEPREVRIVQELTWNGAACDVGEFGVTQVTPVEQDLQPFDPEAMHNEGMVFEPVGSASEARSAAENQFQTQVQAKAGLERLSQLFMRILRTRFALVYHPLWVLRYLYRERAYQVVVDGYTGKVLYGKAPGNTLYRAAMLVGGMALGAFLAVDGPALLFYLAGDSSDGGNLFIAAIVAFVIGLGIMAAAYRLFRHGEQYEYRSAPAASKLPLTQVPVLEMISQVKDMGMITSVKDIEKWIDRLT
jgi:hypothetical protein